LKENWKGTEDVDDDVSSYWMTLMKREDTENLRGKHLIALFGELTLEEAMDLVVRQTA